MPGWAWFLVGAGVVVLAFAFWAYRTMEEVAEDIANDE